VSDLIFYEYVPMKTCEEMARFLTKEGKGTGVVDDGGGLGLTDK